VSEDRPRFVRRPNMSRRDRRRLSRLSDDLGWLSGSAPLVLEDDRDLEAIGRLRWILLEGIVDD